MSSCLLLLTDKHSAAQWLRGLLGLTDKNVWREQLWQRDGWDIKPRDREDYLRVSVRAKPSFCRSSWSYWGTHSVFAGEGTLMAVISNHAAVSGRKGWLLPLHWGPLVIGRDMSHVIRAANLGAASSACQSRGQRSLATHALQNLLSWETKLLQKMCLMVYFGHYLCHISLPRKKWKSVVNHLFGVCYFFTSLLKDIILYAIGFEIIMIFSSEPLLNKLLAKTIWSLSTICCLQSKS